MLKRHEGARIPAHTEGSSWVHQCSREWRTRCRCSAEHRRRLRAARRDLPLSF
jgi:hypothetical protein